MATEKTRDLRQRTYATIVYPDSAPNDWQDILARLCIPAFISPLHDKDTNPTGEPKKPHYHLLVAYPNATTLNNFCNLFQVCGLQKSDLHIVQLCYSGVGYFRYLTHKDNPEKAQYDDNKIRIYNDYDGVFEKFQKTEKDKTNNLVRIFQLVDELDTISFHTLMQYLMLNEVELFKMITSSSALAICIKEYQRSLEYDKKNYRSKLL